MFNIVEATELTHVLTIEQANRLLKDGWHLIQTFTYIQDEEFKNDLSVGYVLAK